MNNILGHTIVSIGALMVGCLGYRSLCLIDEFKHRDVLIRRLLESSNRN